MHVAGYAMIAMPLTYSGFSNPQARAPSNVSAVLFQPPDPNIVNSSIPAFFIGRDRDGFWLARDVRGENGGAFLLKSSALAFARRVSRPCGCATIVASETFELDIKNQGNPLIDYLKPLVRFFTSARKGTANG